MSAYVAGERLEIGIFTDPTTGKKTWVTSRTFGFEVGGDFALGLGAMIVVPEYFETDLGTIPRWLRWLFNPSDPRYSRAFVVHDYVNMLTAKRPPGPGVWSSQVAAGLLYDALRLDGAAILPATILTAGVFLGIAKAER